MDLTAAEQRVLDAIDERELVEHLVDLVRTPSVTGTDAESTLQHEAATQLARLGMDVDTWQLDLAAIRADPDFPGTEAERLEAHGLVATSPGEGPIGLILQGHVDVVPVGDRDNWRDGDPFSGSIVGNVLHGRGACDMKAGVAANFAVARALTRSGVATHKRLAIHSVVSEEDGGLGAFDTLRRGHIGEAAIITEPTSGRLITANAGALTFEIRVTGQAAHGSTRLEGVSAYEVFWPIHLALRELEARRNATPDPLFADHALAYGISIGRIVAGDWSSSVPDLLVAQGRYGIQLGEDLAAARREFEDAVAEAARRDPWLTDHPPAITWPGGQFGSGRIAADHPLIAEVQHAAATISGRVPQPAAAPYGSDLRLYTDLGGIPTLHFGPGDVRMAHAPREHVDLDEVIAVTRALALVTVRRLRAPTGG